MKKHKKINLPKRKGGFRINSKHPGTNNVKKHIVGKIESETVSKIANVSYPLYTHILKYEEYEGMWLKALQLFNHLITHRGPLQGTKRFKEIRTYALKHSLGLPVKPVSCLSLNKKGFPRDLSFLKRYLLGTPEEMQMALTILNISRLSMHSKKLTNSDLFSITKGNSQSEFYKKTIMEFDTAIPGILDQLGIKRNQDPKEVLETEELIFQTSSQGPNSKGRNADALLTSPLDAKALVNNKKLLGHVRNVLDTFGKGNFVEYIEELADTCSKDDGKVYHSKIINVPNPENKQRIVAMVDYWTQASLLPYQNFLSKIEKKVPNSYMFDQDAGRLHAKTFTKESTPISLDGSDFTDRFPMDLQKVVLKHLFNEDVSNKISALMVDRSFYVEDTKSYVRYQVGQPMGMHCSFHLANICHSLLAIWCCNSTNKQLSDSCVVGDDIIFKYDDSAQRYEYIMETLHMSFSEFKGFTSNKTVSVGEFCKKLYLNGTEISGYSPKPFLNVTKDYKFVITLKEHLNVSQRVFGDVVQRAIKSKYHNDTYDLLTLASLSRTSDINTCRSWIHKCSENIRNLYDDIQDLKLGWLQKLAVRKLVFDSLLIVRAEENKKSSHLVQQSLKSKDYSIRAPRTGRDPESSGSTRILDFVRDFMSAKLTSKTGWLLRFKQADKSGVITPLAILMNRHTSEKSVVERDVKLASPIELRDLILDDGKWGIVLDEVQTGLFTGQFTVFATTQKRFVRDDKDRDKKLFLLSKRIANEYQTKFDVHQFQTV